MNAPPQFDCRAQAFTILAGETVRFEALEYLTLSSATGALELFRYGASAGIPFVLRQVVGDGIHPIGSVALKNTGGSSVTVTVVTSSRAITWNDPSASATTIAVGAAANGAAVSGNPVLTAGYDGATTRTVRTDSSGNQIVVGAVADAGAVGSTAPVMAAVTDGANVRRLRGDTTGALVFGNASKRTYHVAGRALAATSANYVLMAINAGASAGLRLRSLWIMNPGMLTAAALGQLELVRITAAASGGTTQTPTPCDAADAAFSGLARFGGATITAGASLFSADIWIPAAVGPFAPIDLLSTNLVAKDISVASGTANGLALRLVNGAAGAASLAIRAVFTEE